MMKLLLGFAAGYWVANRKAQGQDVVPADVRSLAAKYAADLQIIDSGAENEAAETAMPPVVRNFEGFRLRGWR